MVLAVLYFVAVARQRPGMELVSRSSPSGCSADWRSVGRRWSRPCTSPRSRRRGSAAGSWRSSSSTSCWASLLAFLSNYLIARCDLGDGGMALDAGSAGRPFGPVFLPVVPHAREPPLARRPGAGSMRHGPSSRSSASTVPAIDEEIAEIQAIARPGAPGARRERSSRRKYRKPILLAVAIAMFNQLSGINALMYYAPTIFKMAGAGKDSALLAVGGRGRDEPPLHDAGDDRSSTISAAAS